jgi:hypothetical protein
VDLGIAVSETWNLACGSRKFQKRARQKSGLDTAIFPYQLSTALEAVNYLITGTEYLFSNKICKNRGKNI